MYNYRLHWQKNIARNFNSFLCFSIISICVHLQPAPNCSQPIKRQEVLIHFPNIAKTCIPNVTPCQKGIQTIQKVVRANIIHHYMNWLTTILILWNLANLALLHENFFEKKLFRVLELKINEDGTVNYTAAVTNTFLVLFFLLI